MLVSWGTLRGTGEGPWLGVRFVRRAVTNVSACKDGLMHGEAISFDLATLCEPGGVPVDQIRAAAAPRRRRPLTGRNDDRPQVGV